MGVGYGCLLVCKLFNSVVYFHLLLDVCLRVIAVLDSELLCSACCLLFLFDFFGVVVCVVHACYWRICTF